MATPAALMKLIPGYFTREDVRSLTNKDNVFTIKASGTKMVGQGNQAEEKVVVSFESSKKELVLNATRAGQLLKLFGADTDLTGKSIRLELDEIRGTEQIIVTSAE